MPVIAGRHGNRVQILTVERLADILQADRLAAAFLPDLLRPRIVQPTIGIDQMRDLDLFTAREFINVRRTSPINPRHPDTNRIVSADHLPRRLRSPNRKQREHCARRSPHRDTCP